MPAPRNMPLPHVCYHTQFRRSRTFWTQVGGPKY